MKHTYKRMRKATTTHSELMSCGGDKGAGGGGRAEAEWQRIYNRVEALAARLEALNGLQHEFWDARDKINQALLHQAELSRSRWEAAYRELLPGDNPKLTELLECDLEDSRTCEAVFDIENSELKVQLKEVRSCVELNEKTADHEHTSGDLISELRKLKRASETLCSNKDKEATEAAQKLRQNIEELQVAAQKKDDEIGKLQAETSASKNKILVLEGKLEEMHSLDKENDIQKLNVGQPEAHKRELAFLSADVASRQGQRLASYEIRDQVRLMGQRTRGAVPGPEKPYPGNSDEKAMNAEESKLKAAGDKSAKAAPAFRKQAEAEMRAELGGNKKQETTEEVNKPAEKSKSGAGQGGELNGQGRPSTSMDAPAPLPSKCLDDDVRRNKRKRGELTAQERRQGQRLASYEITDQVKLTGQRTRGAVPNPEKPSPGNSAEKAMNAEESKLKAAGDKSAKAAPAFRKQAEAEMRAELGEKKKQETNEEVNKPAEKSKGVADQGGELNGQGWPSASMDAPDEGNGLRKVNFVRRSKLKRGELTAQDVARRQGQRLASYEITDQVKLMGQRTRGAVPNPEKPPSPGNGLRKVKTQCHPDRIFDMVNLFKEDKQLLVGNMGCQSMLAMNNRTLDSGLSHDLLWLVDTTAGTLRIGHTHIPIRPYVRAITGLPNGPTEIKADDSVSHFDGDELFNELPSSTLGLPLSVYLETDDRRFSIKFILAIIALYVAPSKSPANKDYKNIMDLSVNVRI